MRCKILGKQLRLISHTLRGLQSLFSFWSIFQPKIHEWISFFFGFCVLFLIWLLKLKNLIRYCVSFFVFMILFDAICVFFVFYCVWWDWFVFHFFSLSDMFYNFTFVILSSKQLSWIMASILILILFMFILHYTAE